MAMRRRLVAALCCALLALEPAYAGRLKGAGRRSLQTVTVTRPPVEDEPAPTATKAPNAPKAPAPAPKAPPAPQPEAVTYDHYTWSSGDGTYPKSVHAVVSKSMHDAYEAKTKGDSKYASKDSYNSAQSKQKGNTNRSPEHVTYKSSGGKDGSYNKSAKQSGYKSGNKGGGSYTNSIDKGGSYNKGSEKYKSGGGGGKNGSNNKSHKQSGNKSTGGGSYDGGSPDMPEYKPSRSDTKGSTKGSKYSSSKQGTGKSKDPAPPKPPGTTPQPPPPGMAPPEGEPLTGVPVSRFAINYYIDHDMGMPMTSDYEEVHENTYLWLYTIMYQTYGNRMRNLLTDDTSNIYEANMPVLIEYASVILFDSDDEDIPTTEELDLIVVEAFTGSNNEAYVDGLQSLPSSNPFSSTTIAQLQNNPAGRTVTGGLASRVSVRGMMPAAMAAAACFVLLAGGAAAYKSSRRSSGMGPDGKGFDAFTTTDTTVADDFTVAMSNVPEKSGRPRSQWDLRLEEDPQKQENLSPLTEHHLDPDLAVWSDYFDSSNGSKDSDNSSAREEHSQYSIEDFVNEAERNLLGVRIRYPGESETMDPEGNETEVTTALVRAPPSSIVRAPPTSMVPAASDAIGQRFSC